MIETMAPAAPTALVRLFAMITAFKPSTQNLPENGTQLII